MILLSFCRFIKPQKRAHLDTQYEVSKQALDDIFNILKQIIIPMGFIPLLGIELLLNFKNKAYKICLTLYL